MDESQQKSQKLIRSFNQPSKNPKPNKKESPHCFFDEKKKMIEKTAFCFYEKETKGGNDG